MKYKCYIFFIVLSTWLNVSCGHGIESKGLPLIVIETEVGDIYAILNSDVAPVSATAFVNNIKQDYYADAAFYRVLSDENQPSGVPKSNLIQGGIWQKPGVEQSRRRIVHEHTGITGLSHMDGTLSFARQDTGTASTEFFICIGEQPGFDKGGKNNADGYGYAAFGRVVKGMKVVRAIQSRPQEGQYFNPVVKIKRIKILTP